MTWVGVVDGAPPQPGGLHGGCCRVPSAALIGAGAGDGAAGDRAKAAAAAGAARAVAGAGVGGGAAARRGGVVDEEKEEGAGGVPRALLGRLPLLLRLLLGGEAWRRR